jgi:hypothetical protein
MRCFPPGAIHGDGRAGGELPDRCVPDLRHQTWAHFPGSGTVPAQGLDRRPGTVRGRGDLRGPGVQDQAGTGDGHAGPSLDTGAPARWVTGDAVYGQYHRLRRTLEERGLHYLLVVPVSQRVIVKDGTVFGTEKRADAAVAGLRPTAWRTRSAVERSKGVRDYAWARMRINGAKTDTCDTGCSSAGPWPSPERSRVSSAAPEARRPGGNGLHRRVRWAIEGTFQIAETLLSLNFVTQVRFRTAAPRAGGAQLVCLHHAERVIDTGAGQPQGRGNL